MKGGSIVRGATASRKAALFRSLGAGIAGFLVYGGWAYYVNADHGHDMGVMAGVTQGTYSFVLTMSTTYLMEFLLITFRHMPGRRTATVVVTSVITFGTAFGIHFLIGTPEILLTILPGFLIGTAYTVSYVTAVSVLDNGQAGMKARQSATE